MRWGLVRVGGDRGGGEQDQVPTHPLSSHLPWKVAIPLGVTSGILDVIAMVLKTWEPQIPRLHLTCHLSLTFSVCLRAGEK